MIEENVVVNICLWDGDVNSWQPPSNTTMLVQSTTPTKVWELNEQQTEYVLTDSIGNADIGFTWNGTVATTNEPQPVAPQPAE